MAQQVNGAEAVIAVLESLGVEYIFGYPGGANLPLYDALARSKKITHVLARHEQGAGFMASGYARLKGKAGVCLATSGPGVTNLITAVADCFLDSVPLVAICGQIHQDFIGTDAFQEVDTFNITSPITKHNELVSDPDELVSAIRTAFYLANSGRFGPVLVDIPRDIQEHKQEYNLTAERELPGYQPTTNAHIGQIKRTVRAINRSAKPLIIAGGGVAQAKSQQLLINFVETLGIPVVRTLMGKGVMPEDHSQYIGMIGTHGTAEANKALTQADLVLVIGSRLSDRTTMLKKEYFVREAVVVHIDIDPAEISKSVPVDIPVVGDLAISLQMILDEFIAQKRERKDHWFVKKNNNNILSKVDHAETISLVLSELSTIDTKFHITTDVGRHQMWATHYCNNVNHWPILTSGGLGTMGFGLPAAIGCWFADKTQPVVNISGDGSFFMNMQEFYTAVEYEIPLVVIIVNDNKLGMIQELQEAKYNKRYFANEFKHRHDFVALAKAFGAEGYNISSEKQIRPTLIKALELKKPVIVNFDLYQVALSQRIKALG